VHAHARSTANLAQNYPTPATPQEVESYMDYLAGELDKATDDTLSVIVPRNFTDSLVRQVINFCGQEWYVAFDQFSNEGGRPRFMRNFSWCVELTLQRRVTRQDIEDETDRLSDFLTMCFEGGLVPRNASVEYEIPACFSDTQVMGFVMHAKGIGYQIDLVEYCRLKRGLPFKRSSEGKVLLSFSQLPWPTIAYQSEAGAEDVVQILHNLQGTLQKLDSFKRRRLILPPCLIPEQIKYVVSALRCFGWPVHVNVDPITRRYLCDEQGNITFWYGPCEQELVWNPPSSHPTATRSASRWQDLRHNFVTRER
jgi:hypothetical protein